MAARSKPGVKAPYPDFIEPALATSVEKVPRGDRWIHEIKFDGYRVQVHLRDAVVKVFTPRGNDWSDRFRKIAVDAWHVNAGSAIIDGEVVVPAADGTTGFAGFALDGKMQPYTKKIAHRGVWVEPSLLAEIEYRAKSSEGKVRHPVFKGLRKDLSSVPYSVFASKRAQRIRF